MIPMFDLRYVAFDPKTGVIRQWTARPNDVEGLGVAEVVGDLPLSGEALNYKVDLESVDLGTCRLVEIPAAERQSFFEPPLDQLKIMLTTGVDREAERERMRYITAGDGQGLVYGAKSTEVARWRLAGSPSDPAAADYPWAGARAKRRGASVHDALSEWAAKADAWAMIGIAIENEREGAKEAIGAAADVKEASAIVAAVVWPDIKITNDDPQREPNGE